MGTYAVAESKDPAYKSGFGNLTVHEVKTDPRRRKDIAYFSYDNAGLRVASFGSGGIKEIGHYIAPGGSDFWGVSRSARASARSTTRIRATGRTTPSGPCCS